MVRAFGCVMGINSPMNDTTMSDETIATPAEETTEETAAPAEEEKKDEAAA